MPRQIVTDRSTALMASTLKVFNSETIPNFLKRAHRIVTKSSVPADFQLMIPHVCCSHMMKNFHHAIKSSNVHRDFRNFFLYLCSLLVNARTLEELTDTYKDTYLLLSSEFRSAEVDEAYEVLREKTKKLGSDRISEVESLAKEDTTGMEDRNSEKKDDSMNSENPFHAHFEKEREKIEETKKRMDFRLSKNLCFSTAFLEYIHTALRTCPFWSAMLLGSLKRYNKPGYPSKALTFTEVNTRTQGNIELYFKLLKAHDFRGRKRLRVDEFLKEQYDKLDKRIVSFAEDSLRHKGSSSRITKTSSKEPSEKIKEEDYEMSQETWFKPTKIKRDTTGKYQRPPTTQFPKSVAEDKREGSKSSKKLAGFDLFYMDNEIEIGKRNPKESNLLRAAAKEWKHLSKEDRNKWRAKAIEYNFKHTCQTKRDDLAAIPESNNQEEKQTAPIVTEVSASSRNLESTTLTSKDKDYAIPTQVSPSKPNGYIPTGLLNFGSSCWLNSLLQCICASQLSLHILDVIFTENDTIGYLISKVLKEMWNQDRTVAEQHLTTLYVALSAKYQYHGQQQDAGEQIEFLLEDIRDASSTGSDPTQCASGLSARSRQCLSCMKKTFMQDEPMSVFPLAMPQTASKLKCKTSVQSLLDKFFGDQINQTDCDKCGCISDHVFRTSCTACPHVLILNVKRYSSNMSKITSRVLVDETITLTKHGARKKYLYTLKALVLHKGINMQSGHYTSAIPTTDNNIWFHADDHNVRRAKKGNIAKMAERDCYILFYERTPETEEEEVSEDDDHDEEEEEEEEEDDKEMEEEEREKEYEEVQTNNKVAFDELLQKSRNAEYKEEVIVDTPYYKLKGKDLKTLEFPQVDFSYSLENPGWINDNIMTAVLKQIEMEAREAGLNIKTMDTMFSHHIKRVKSLDGNRLEEFLRLLRRMKDVDVKNTHLFIVPQNTNGSHWTITIVNHCSSDHTEVWHYDPADKSDIDEEFCDLLADFFDLALNISDTAIIKRGAERILRGETNFPSQCDVQSCGVYCLVYAKVISTIFKCPKEFRVNPETSRAKLMEGLLRGSIDWSSMLPAKEGYLQIHVHPPKEVQMAANSEVNVMCLASGQGSLKYKWITTDALYDASNKGGLGTSNTLTVKASCLDNQTKELICEISDDNDTHDTSAMKVIPIPESRFADELLT